MAWRNARSYRASPSIYKPEELVGKQVCFIANLAPRKLKGIVSEGMILSAENFDGKLAVITPEKEVKPGSEVK